MDEISEIEDFDLALADDSLRNSVVSALSDLVSLKYRTLDGICCLANRDIPWGAAVADSLSLPLIYSRLQPKGHGLKRQVEGFLPVGSKVALVFALVDDIDDVLTLHKVLVEESELEVLGVVCAKSLVDESVLTSAGIDFEVV